MLCLFVICFVVDSLCLRSLHTSCISGGAQHHAPSCLVLLGLEYWTWVKMILGRPSDLWSCPPTPHWSLHSELRVISLSIRKPYCNSSKLCLGMIVNILIDTHTDRIFQIPGLWSGISAVGILQAWQCLEIWTMVWAMVLISSSHSNEGSCGVCFINHTIPISKL